MRPAPASHRLSGIGAPGPTIPMPDHRPGGDGSGSVHTAFLAALDDARRKALARTLNLTEATLHMAARSLVGSDDLGDRGALLAVAVRLFPGPYAVAALLGVSGESLALYGEALLVAMGRPVPPLTVETR